MTGGGIEKAFIVCSQCTKHCSKAHYVGSPVTSLSQPNTVRATIGPTVEMKKPRPKETSATKAQEEES